MAEKPDRIESGRPRSRRWFIYVGLLVLAVVGILIVQCWRRRGAFRERIEAMRAAGYPVTLEELDASYEWPASGDNAANWILDAAALQQKLSQEDSRRLEQLVRRDGQRPDYTEPIPDAVRDLLEQYIRSNGKALELLHDAAGIRGCRYPIDLTKGLGTLMPHLAEVRSGCLLLCLEAVLCAEGGDPNGAAEAVVAALGVARSLDQEPVFISHLAWMSGASWAASTLERVLNRVALADADMETLHRTFSDICADEGLLRALAADRCVMIPVFEDPRAAGVFFPQRVPVPLLEAYGALGFSAREGGIFLDYMEECIRIAQLPMSERCAAVRALETRLGDRRGLFLSDTRSVHRAISRDVQIVAQLETAEAALAVERYRLANGVLPVTFAQLVPRYLEALPTDPFDGLPLRYKQIHRGFLVYSVGEDGRDDGGTEQQPDDLTFRVER